MSVKKSSARFSAGTLIVEAFKLLPRLRAHCLDTPPIRLMSFRAAAFTTVLAISICLRQSPTWAYEPVPSGTTFFNRSGVAIPSESLRFANGGWSRGRDQGFAFALQKNTSYFYLWVQTPGGAPLGRHLFCDGKLVDGKGEAVRVDSIMSFTLGDLKGRGSN